MRVGWLYAPCVTVNASVIFPAMKPVGERSKCPGERVNERKREVEQVKRDL